MQFTCTAMRRPGIVRDAFRSYAANLRGVDWTSTRLWLNIDPLPAAGELEGVVSAAHAVFGEVIVNLPARPSFPAAVKWCWSKPTEPFFMHLEDDWILHEVVDVGAMQAHLDVDPGLSLVNLRAYPHNDDRLCLAPGLWRTEHARELGRLMRTDANPERQLRPRTELNPHGGLHVGYRGRQFPPRRVIRDIGRAWRAVNRIKAGRDFTTWEA